MSPGHGWSLGQLQQRLRWQTLPLLDIDMIELAESRRVAHSMTRVIKSFARTRAAAKTRADVGQKTCDQGFSQAISNKVISSLYCVRIRKGRAIHQTVLRY